MKEVGVFFSGLVQELAGLREEAVRSQRSLQAEHDKLEDGIREAQDRHQAVRAGLRDTRPTLSSDETLLTPGSI